MRKFLIVISLSMLSLGLCGFSFFSGNEEVEEQQAFQFDINDFYNYHKNFDCEEIEPCSTNDTKTYMDYRLTADVTSVQYWFINNNLNVDYTGFLYDDDGFIAAALGSYYGEIGSRYYFTLDTGVVLPIVKAEEKADGDVYDGCYHKKDGSVIEFVIDTDKAGEFFGVFANGLVLQGNYNNYDLFSGSIVKVEKVLDDKLTEYVTYKNGDIYAIDESFNYGSGY